MKGLYISAAALVLTFIMYLENYHSITLNMIATFSVVIITVTLIAAPIKSRNKWNIFKIDSFKDTPFNIVFLMSLSIVATAIQTGSDYQTLLLALTFAVVSGFSCIVSFYYMNKAHPLRQRSKLSNFCNGNKLLTTAIVSAKYAFHAKSLSVIVIIIFLCSLTILPNIVHFFLRSDYDFNQLNLLLVFAQLFIICCTHYSHRLILLPALHSAKNEANELQSLRINDKLKKNSPIGILNCPGKHSTVVDRAIDTLNKSGIRYFIITRDLTTFSVLSKRSNIKVVYCRKLQEIEPFIMGTVTSIFHINNHGKNAHFTSYHELNHILLEADTNCLEISPSYGMFTHRLIKASATRKNNYIKCENVDGTITKFNSLKDAIKIIASSKIVTN